MAIELSTQQQQAIASVGRWLENRNQPVFRLFGYAGTGKTTIAQEFAKSVNGSVLFGSFTGKAALVMQQKGCYGAQTIHRLIYLPNQPSKQQLEELQMELAELKRDPDSDPNDIAYLEDEIKQEITKLRQPRFGLNPDSDVSTCTLLVIDEVSMVGRRMGEDLMSFNRPILVLGDPAQLPPVGEGGYFTKQKPDFLLTEIHRQSADSPVLKMATMIRESVWVEEGTYGSSRVVPRGVLSIADVAAHDQVIVGTNKARKDLNAQIRKHLGRKTSLPEPGDKLVCLRNNYETGLLNGSQWIVQSAEVSGEDTIYAIVADESGRTIDVSMWRHPFEGREDDLAPWDMRKNESFDFGFAMTCHKSQGSQWGSVLVIDESSVFRGDSKRWLYTAVTRAAERVTIVRKY